jgi:MFS family permease
MTGCQAPRTSAGQAPNKRVYYRLFVAQVLALVSTGVATVALALLAYELVGADAGAVLGTALAIKMLAYVVIAPIAAALAERLPRRTLLVGLDLVRGGIALTLPFVAQVWQVYVLIFLFQAASAVFTPTYQSTIPDLLPREADYTKALARSRLAYELESLASPAVAAGLLLLMSFHGLFAGTTIGFLVSAALILRVELPDPTSHAWGGLVRRTAGALRRFLGTARLRGLLALNLVAAAATSMVTVNTVVLAGRSRARGARHCARARGLRRRLGNGRARRAVAAAAGPIAPRCSPAAAWRRPGCWSGWRCPATSRS